MTSCVCVHMCVCSACNRVILVATAVNGKISMKTDENILNLVCLHAFYVHMYVYVVSFGDFLPFSRSLSTCKEYFDYDLFSLLPHAVLALFY